MVSAVEPRPALQWGHGKPCPDKTAGQRHGLRSERPAGAGACQSAGVDRDHVFVKPSSCGCFVALSDVIELRGLFDFARG